MRLSFACLAGLSIFPTALLGSNDPRKFACDFVDFKARIVAARIALMTDENLTLFKSETSVHVKDLKLYARILYDLYIKTDGDYLKIWKDCFNFSNVKSTRFYESGHILARAWGKYVMPKTVDDSNINHFITTLGTEITQVLIGKVTQI